MMKTRALLAIPIALFLSNEAQAQEDLVFTSHDDTVSFSGFRTFALLDSVVHIDFVDTANDMLLNRSNDAVILSQIAANMEALGYVEVSDPRHTTPDVVLLVGALAVVQTAYFDYDWWPSWGWGYAPDWDCCEPESGWAYPWEPDVSVSYGVGTLLIAMTDPGRLVNEYDTPLLWMVGINGLLVGSDANLRTRVTSAIDEAFHQSPYLRPNVKRRN